MVSAASSSYWHGSGGPQLVRAALPGDRSVDVAIVGGGLTGLWTSSYLAKADFALRMVALEGYGATLPKPVGDGLSTTNLARRTLTDLILRRATKLTGPLTGH